MFKVGSVFACDNVDKETRLHEKVMGQMEQALLRQLLAHTKGNQSKAASILGITRGSLRTKMKTHGIVISAIVDVEEARVG